MGRGSDSKDSARAGKHAAKAEKHLAKADRLSARGRYVGVAVQTEKSVPWWKR